MSVASLSVKDVNALSGDDFIKLFGNVVEHYPAAAIGMLKSRPFNSTEEICAAVGRFIDSLSVKEKEDILRLHPDLAGRLADLGNLTAESAEEQKSAGLNKLTREQKQKLNNFNERYKHKFGIPFVICAKENNAATILKAMEERLSNNKLEELNNGINEVKKISALRISQIIEHE